MDLEKTESGLTPTSDILRPVSLAKPKPKKALKVVAAGLIILAVAAVFFVISLPWPIF